MVVQAKGWGWAVFYVPLALLVVVIGLAAVFGGPEADGVNQDRYVDRLCAVWLLLSAVIVLMIDRYREVKTRRVAEDNRRAMVPRDDEFLYMRMWAWPYVLAALGLWAFAASFFA